MLGGTGARGCPGSPRLHGPALRLCHLQQLWEGVFMGSPAATVLSGTRSHPRLGYPQDQAHLLHPMAGGRGAGWGRAATGSWRHSCCAGTARVGSALFPGGEMGTAAAC